MDEVSKKFVEKILLLAIPLLWIGFMSGCMASNENTISNIDGKKCDQQVVLNDSSGLKKIFCVEIADDSLERAKGLMWRESMADDMGMLFLFDESEYLSFWMKNTLIPLDILYFDENGLLVDYKNDFKPCRENESCVGYVSKLSAKYVLEINSDLNNENYWQSQIGKLKMSGY
jgi:uncharacterized membrane protein (UPF0127 family)